MQLAQLQSRFQSLPPLSTSKLSPSGSDSQWMVLCMFQDPVGLSNTLSCETGSFSCCLNSHKFLQLEVLRLYVPTLEAWVAQSVSLPSCSFWFICMQMWDHPFCQPPPHLVCQLQPCPPWSFIHYLATSPLHPRCLSPPLLPVWMNVSSLTPQLSDFYIA